MITEGRKTNEASPVTLSAYCMEVVFRSQFEIGNRALVPLGGGDRSEGLGGQEGRINSQGRVL